MFAKRISMSLLAIGATSLIVSAASFALFTASTTNQQNTFTAGTVTFGAVVPFSCSVNANNLAPGDSGSCTVSVAYSGNLDAWVGVDHSASGALFGGATPMTYSLAGGMGNYNGKYLIGKKTNGDSAGVTVNYTFPLAADNSYQGATGTIDLMFHAVQARNNTDMSGATELGPTSWN